MWASRRTLAPGGCTRRTNGAAHRPSTSGVALRRAPETVAARASPGSTQQMLTAERALLSRFSREELVTALQKLGEEAPPDEDRHALLQRLAARRLAERARIVRLPLRLTFAGRRSSRRYLTVPVDVGDIGFVNFLLEAGSYHCLISPELRGRLGLGPGDGAAVRALDSRGPTVRQRVDLPPMWLGTFKLPSMSACVSELPVSRSGRRPQQQQSQQQQQQPSPQPQQPSPQPLTPQQAFENYQRPGGMLGVRALQCFDIDIDWGGNRLVMHPAGHAAAGLLDTRGLRAVPCRYTKAGLVILSISINGSAPVLGILDLSAGVSILNWEAAELLGVQLQTDEGDTPGDTSSSSSSGSDGSSSGAESSASGRGPSYGAGYFGSIRVRPLEQLALDRPAAAGPGGPQQHSAAGGPVVAPGTHHGGAAGAAIASSGLQIRLPAVAEEMLLGGSTRSSDGGISGSTSINGSSSAGAAAGGGSSSGRPRPPRGAPPGLQVHERFEHEVRLVLGPGAKSGGARLPPPPKLAIAHLKGLAQVGLAGRPAMVVGGDLWGRSRMVLCLKSGIMYL